MHVYALAGHAQVGTCTSAIDLVHGFSAQPSVWHFSALVFGGKSFTWGPTSLLTEKEMGS